MEQSAVSNNKSVVVGHNSITRSRNLYLHIFGTGISTVGDGFSLIALPWLVLSMTADVKQVGIVMALIGFPRAVIMLFSGPLLSR